VINAKILKNDIFLLFVSDTLTEEEDEIGSASSLMGRVKLARQEAIRKKLESEMSDKDILKEKM
jgi:hypothetical protein